MQHKLCESDYPGPFTIGVLWGKADSKGDSAVEALR